MEEVCLVRSSWARALAASPSSVASCMHAWSPSASFDLSSHVRYHAYVPLIICWTSTILLHACAGRSLPSLDRQQLAHADAGGVGEDLVHHRRHLVRRRHLAPFLNLHVTRTHNPNNTIRIYIIFCL